MRNFKLYLTLALVVLVGIGVAVAGDKGLSSRVLTVTPTQTNTTTSVTNATIQGYLESVIFDSPAATITSAVTLVWQPALSTLSSVTLASTNGLAADKTLRPRWVSTDSAGTALASVEGIRFPLTGGKLVFSVTGTSLSGSNTAHKVLIKYYKN